MRNKTLAIKIGNYLYSRHFCLYKVLYAAMKSWQDAPEIKLLKASVSPGDVALDIGANIGFFSRVLSRRVGRTGRVYAFEPEEVNFAHLQQAVKPLGNVTVKQAAVGSAPGSITVFKSPMLNVDHRTYPVDSYTSKSEVECVSIDTFLPPDAAVSFIKMDIQGFEYAALQGMKSTLARRRGKLQMLMELWPAGLKKAGSSASEVVGFLEECGYCVYLLEGKKMSLLSTQAADAHKNTPPN
ncbi:MAG: FkbM family methyltransferase [Prevotellaceae bacterium]|jgi:FkbM family methyltransferase|nr:FkbM family methyltransferase [Prevotellaceae bacterium]